MHETQEDRSPSTTAAPSAPQDDAPALDETARLGESVETSRRPTPVATLLARLRRNSGLDTAELAAQIGMAPQSIRDIEAGRVLPTMRAIWAFARAFDVPFRLLIAGPRFRDDGFHVLRAGDGRTTTSGKGAFRSRSLSASGDPREPEVYEVTLAPGAEEKAAGHSEQTCEHIVVVRGTLRIRAGEGDTTLMPGDSLFFSADVPHSYANPGTEECVAVLTATNGGDWVVS